MRVCAQQRAPGAPPRFGHVSVCALCVRVWCVLTQPPAQPQAPPGSLFQIQLLLTEGTYQPLPSAWTTMARWGGGVVACLPACLPARELGRLSACACCGSCPRTLLTPRPHTPAQRGPCAPAAALRGAHPAHRGAARAVARAAGDDGHGAAAARAPGRHFGPRKVRARACLLLFVCVWWWGQGASCAARNENAHKKAVRGVWCQLHTEPPLNPPAPPQVAPEGRVPCAMSCSAPFAPAHHQTTPRPLASPLPPRRWYLKDVCRTTGTLLTLTPEAERQLQARGEGGGVMWFCFVRLTGQGGLFGLPPPTTHNE